MKEILVEGFTVRLDFAPAVVRINVPEDRGDFPEGDRSPREAPLSPTLEGLTGGGMLSAAVLAAKAKALDDRLLAAAEIGAEEGLGRFPAKARLLAEVAEALAGAPPSAAAEVLLAAGVLGRGGSFSVPASLRTAVEGRIAAFLADRLRSQPIGFYGRDARLARIFRQDRMLQTPLEGKAGIEALARAVAARESTRAAYAATLALAERLTNPFVRPDLRPLVADVLAGRLDAPDRGVSFLPPSRAPETDLATRLFGGRPIPEGFDLAAEVAARVADGRLSLAPEASSGWYAHVLHSLSPLFAPDRTPEAARLSLDPAYRRMLLDLGRGILALARETHIKQLELPAEGCAPRSRVLRLSPGLRLEPLAAHYSRRAESYAFVRGVLEEAFGPEGLSALGADPAEGERLFAGAASAVRADLDLPGATAGEEAFRRVAAGAAADPDVAGDQRMMVPVFFDLARGKVKAWALLGWTSRPVSVGYAKPPKVIEVRGPDGRPARDALVQFESESHRLPYPVTAEVYVSEILDRDAFRSHCDRWETQGEILAHLR